LSCKLHIHSKKSIGPRKARTSRNEFGGSFAASLKLAKKRMDAMSHTYTQMINNLIHHNIRVYFVPFVSFVDNRIFSRIQNGTPSAKVRS